MSWIKYTFLTALLIFFLAVTILFTDYYSKKVMGLGEPIVYDAHKLWGYSPRANKIYRRFQGDIVTINNIGARGLSDWNQKDDNIVFFGDSVTYGGSYIDDNQTFTAVACRSFKKLSCHNLGVNSYGILNMVARSRYDERVNGAKFRVFTFITGDFDRGLQTSQRAHFILREPPTYLSGLWEILNFVAAGISPKSWFGKRSDIKSTQEEIYINRKFKLDIFLDELSRLQENNQKFLLVHSPSREELENLDLVKETEILSILKDVYPDNFISLSDVLLPHYKSNTKLLFKDNVHYEEKGHLIVGKYLEPILHKLIVE